MELICQQAESEIRLSFFEDFPFKINEATIQLILAHPVEATHAGGEDQTASYFSRSPVRAVVSLPMRAARSKNLVWDPIRSQDVRDSRPLSACQIHRENSLVPGNGAARLRKKLAERHALRFLGR